MHIVEMRVGRNTYLYEAESYRNSEGKPRNRMRSVGKVDPVSGEHIFKPEYLKRMRTGSSTDKLIEKTEPACFTVEEIQGSDIKELGAFYLLEGIAEMIGLKRCLKAAFPRYAEELLSLAIHMVCTDEPFLYYKQWIENTEAPLASPLCSQRLSELLENVCAAQRSEFFGLWTQCRRESEYLALDITSISSWSELVEDVEWGYNRDHEKLPQINVCMLMGEKSRLPVYQTVYGGSIKDVSTLTATVRQTVCHMTDRDEVLIVMDKGFYSKKNVDAMLEGELACHFIIPVPFTSKFALAQVESESKDIDTIQNTLVSGADTLRAVSKERAWGDGHKLHTHIYFNAVRAALRRDELYAHVASLREMAEAGSWDNSLNGDIAKYLIIRSSQKACGGHTVSIRQDVLDKELKSAGWMVLVSNHVENCKRAIEIYRAKDVVEKGFMRLKNSIDLSRLRVHSQNRMQGKVFIGFIALVLMSHMNKLMLEKGLYKRMTMRGLILEMRKLRVQHIKEHRILYPLSKAQKEIFLAFDIPLPV